MDSANAILKQFEALARANASNQPLIDANDFNDSTLYGRPVGESPGLVYLGSYLLWLSRHHGLNETELLASPARVPRTAQAFSRQLVGVQLFPHHVAEALRPFTESYVRDTMLYANDYQELVVGRNGLIDMAQVDEASMSFEPLWARIDERLAKFEQHDSSWSATSPRAIAELSADELSAAGWQTAFSNAIRLDGLPHDQREIAIAKFFALVDHVHGSAEPDVVRELLLSFQPSADASLQEAVLRALYSMPFDIVWPAIVADAERLNHVGWLPEVLALWANDYSDEQEKYLGETFPRLPVVARAAIREAASRKSYARSPWAIKLRKLDSIEL